MLFGGPFYILLWPTLSVDLVMYCESMTFDVSDCLEVQPILCKRCKHIKFSMIRPNAQDFLRNSPLYGLTDWPGHCPCTWEAGFTRDPGSLAHDNKLLHVICPWGSSVRRVTTIKVTCNIFYRWLTGLILRQRKTYN